MLDLQDLGKTGYEAYAASTGGKTFDGRDMPKWDDLPPKIQTAWMEAARAIAVSAHEKGFFPG